MRESVSRLARMPAREGDAYLFAQQVFAGGPAFVRRAGIDFVPGRREGSCPRALTGMNRLIDCRCHGGVFAAGRWTPEVIKVLVQCLR